jgi:apolipoprotein N-acyltransferase
VTPETAFPVGLIEVNPALLAKMRSFSSATGSNIFLGAPYLDIRGKVRNSMFHLAPERSELARYDKTRLMPFGEYTPVGLNWFTRRMNVALDDQSPGLTDQRPFDVKKLRTVVPIGVLICHEDLSYAAARRWASQSSLFINPGNLAWFEGSMALNQRLQVASIRALETGRPLLRITNTGVTAHIDSKGRIVSSLPSNAPGILAGSIQPTAGLTPFVRFGNLLTIAVALAVLLGTAVAPRRKSNTRAAQSP